MERELKTDRLLLRAFAPTDLETVFALYSDPEVNRFLPWHPLQTKEDARRLLSRECAMQEPYRYAVCFRRDGVLIGYIHVEKDGARDLGYGLCRRCWNQGIITEGCFAVIDQLKGDGVEDRTYQGYWEKYQNHWIEHGL